MALFRQHDGIVVVLLIIERRDPDAPVVRRDERQVQAIRRAHQLQRDPYGWLGVGREPQPGFAVLIGELWSPGVSCRPDSDIGKRMLLGVHHHQHQHTFFGQHGAGHEQENNKQQASPPAIGESIDVHWGFFLFRPNSFQTRLVALQQNCARSISRRTP
jgi:hypothetical protein